MRNANKKKRLLAFVMMLALLTESVLVTSTNGAYLVLAKGEVRRAEAVTKAYDAAGLNPVSVQENGSGSEAVSTELTTEAIITEATEAATTQAVTTQEIIVPERAYNLFVADKSGSSVKISWFLQNMSADGFYIYRKDNYKTSYKKVGEVASGNTLSLFYTDSNLVRGVKYTYKVLPYHVKADQSIVTDSYSNTCSYKWSYAKPVIKSAKRSGRTITIRWSKISGASGYEIYRSVGKGYKLAKRIKKGTATSVKLTKQSKNTDMVFKIKAYSKYNGKRIYSGYSDTFTVYSTGVQKVLNKIAKLKKQYPSYYYWNHVGQTSFSSSTITRNPCNHSVYGLRQCNYYYCPNGVLGLQCYGFAWKMSDLIYGRDAKYKSHNSFANAKVGDVIRYSGHSVIIIEKHKSYIKVGECNIGGTCMILWGRKVTKSELKGATYFHRYY